MIGVLVMVAVVLATGWSMGRTYERSRWCSATDRMWHDAHDHGRPQVRRAMHDLEGVVLYGEANR